MQLACHALTRQAALVVRCRTRSCLDAVVVPVGSWTRQIACMVSPSIRQTTPVSRNSLHVCCSQGRSYCNGLACSGLYRRYVGSSTGSANEVPMAAKPALPADFQHEGDEIPAQARIDTNTDADVMEFEADPALASQQTLPAATNKTVIAALTGNALVFLLKLVVWYRSGSSAMLAEVIHTLIDTANQALLALGLRQSVLRADVRHQYGYGKAAFVWGMISALGMLWAGGGVSILHGMQTLVSPDHTPTLNWESWAVLGFSFVVDGSVLVYSMRELASRTSQQFADIFPQAGLIQKAKLIWQHMRHSSDPFMTAVALEDVAACAGVVVAASGIGLSQLMGTPACDSIASIAIGGMLATVAVTLVRLNMRYLIGQSINSEKSSEIAALIRSFPAIDGVRYVHTQWLSPSSFSLSAKIDFDGTYLAAKLHREYEDLFLKSTNLHDDLPLFLSFFAEDVTRLVETELKSIEGSIREKFPGAAIIELEPDSKESDVFIVKAMREAANTRAEMSEVLNHHLAVLQALKQTRPNDPRIAAQEARITEWYSRRLSSLAVRTTGKVPGTSATTSASPSKAEE